MAIDRSRTVQFRTVSIYVLKICTLEIVKVRLLDLIWRLEERSAVVKSKTP